MTSNKDQWWCVLFIIIQQSSSERTAAGLLWEHYLNDALRQTVRRADEVPSPAHQLFTFILIFSPSFWETGTWTSHRTTKTHPSINLSSELIKQLPFFWLLFAVTSAQLGVPPMAFWNLSNKSDGVSFPVLSSVKQTCLFWLTAPLSAAVASVWSFYSLLHSF